MSAPRLTIQVARQIRAARADGNTFQSIADQFEVSTRTVFNIVTGRTHIEQAGTEVSEDDFRDLFRLIAEADQNMGIVLDMIDGKAAFRVQDVLCAARGRLAQAREHLEDKMLLSYDRLGFESERVQ